MLEKNFQTQMKKHLKENGAYVHNVIGSAFTTSGTPDLLVCYKGIFFGIELKVGNNKASALQAHHIKLIKESGGSSFVFYHSKGWKESIIEKLNNKTFMIKGGCYVK